MRPIDHKYLSHQNIICMASANWKSQTRVNVHHVMAHLAAQNRVLYVEPIGLRFPSAKKSDISKICYRMKGWFQGIRQENTNLWILSPLFIPLHQFRWVQLFNRLIITFTLKYYQKKFSFFKSILWVFLPTGVDVVGRLDEALVIYHCVDQYAFNPQVDKKSISLMEEKLLKKADLVFTTSSNLYQDKVRFNARTYYFPNVADTSHFQKALIKDTIVPSDLKNIPKPRACFIGALSRYKIDFDLLLNVADRLPDIQFVLIGPTGIGDPGTDISMLENRPNIHLLGPRDYEHLPNYLKGMDVCLIPFRLNETTIHVFPIKFFEYLAAGKPVVSTPLPALDEFSAFYDKAENDEQFSQAIIKSIKKKRPLDKDQMIKLNSQYSWEKRISDFSEIIRDFLSEHISEVS